jgi:hypothetical protein
MNLKKAKGIIAKKQSWAEMDKSDTPFEKLRNAYAVFNRTVNRSPRTIKWYDDKLILFGRFLGPNAKLRDCLPRYSTNRSPSEKGCWIWTMTLLMSSSAD